MNRLFSVDNPEHAHASEVLPWYVNGSLDAAEKAKVEHHVGECAACRAELGALQELQAYVRTEGVESPVNESLARMHVRLAEHEGAADSRGGWFRMQWSLTPSAVRVALAAQCMLVLALALFAGLQPLGLRPSGAEPQGRPGYRTLSAAPAAAPTAQVTVVFADGTTEGEMRQILQRLQARIVEGPNSVGALGIAMPEGNIAAALNELRSSPQVVFAEPALSAASPR